MKVSTALLLHMRENGGVLPPAQLEAWVAQMMKAGYLARDIRKLDGYDLPHHVITEKGLEHLRKAGV